MHQDNYSGDSALTGRSGSGPDARPRGRGIVPPDGSIAKAGGHVSVFCASCERWIDCYEGILPEIALDRHIDLIH
jgi:hypothetical protein